MNDTTSTPDDAGGRGPVATGGKTEIPAQADGTESAAKAGSSNGSAGTGMDGTSPGSTADPAAEPVSTPAAPAGADAPTADLQLPTASNGSAANPGESAEAQRPDQPPRPSPTPHAPEPAPGPVPGPGPEAAPPPPWHRMPSPEAAPPPQQPARDPAIGGLLEEGPTAFLEPPTRPAVEPVGGGGASQATSGSTGSESGSWAAVRAVRNRPPRQAALQLKRLDPWSVLKLGLVLAVVLFFIWLVAVGVLYGVLDGMGVWDRLNGTYAELVSGEVPGGTPLISAPLVFGFAAVIGAINSLLFAVAVTVGAFVYNVSADLVGGIEVTLSERD